MLTVLVSTISNAQVFAFHIFFQQNIRVYAIFNDQSFNNMLTNDIFCFEQLGPRTSVNWKNTMYIVRVAT